jgi:hypothetical protein
MQVLQCRIAALLCIFGPRLRRDFGVYDHGRSDCEIRGRREEAMLRLCRGRDGRVRSRRLYTKSYLLASRTNKRVLFKRTSVRTLPAFKIGF